MCVDAVGLCPASDKGAWFRNNEWWWEPLREYCEVFHADLAGCLRRPGDGGATHLTPNSALTLGRRLLADVEDGLVAGYEADYNSRLANLPIDECESCEGSGIRVDQVGIAAGMPGRELQEWEAIIFGRTHGWCDGCHGSGRQVSQEVRYSFCEENVLEFAEFLVDSGGSEFRWDA